MLAQEAGSDTVQRVRNGVEKKKKRPLFFSLKQGTSVAWHNQSSTRQLLTYLQVLALGALIRGKCLRVRKGCCTTEASLRTQSSEGKSDMKKTGFGNMGEGKRLQRRRKFIVSTNMAMFLNFHRKLRERGNTDSYINVLTSVSMKKQK